MTNPTAVSSGTAPEPGNSPTEASSLDPATIALEAKREYNRLLEVEMMIGGFERRMQRAQASGDTVCRFIKLDTVAEGAPAPVGRSDLGSEAYEMLWDHIEKQGAKPLIIESKIQATAAAPVVVSYWLSAEAPGKVMDETDSKEQGEAAS